MNYYNITLVFNNSTHNPNDILNECHVPSEMSINKLHNLFNSIINTSKVTQIVNHPLPVFYFSLIVRAEYGLLNEFIIDFSIFADNIELAKTITRRFINNIEYR